MFHKGAGENLFGSAQENPDGCPQGHLVGFEPYGDFYKEGELLDRIELLYAKIKESGPISSPEGYTGANLQVYRHADGAMALVELFGDRYALEC